AAGAPRRTCRSTAAPAAASAGAAGRTALARGAICSGAAAASAAAASPAAAGVAAAVAALARAPGRPAVATAAAVLLDVDAPATNDDDRDQRHDDTCPHHPAIFGRSRGGIKYQPLLLGDRAGGDGVRPLDQATLRRGRDAAQRVRHWRAAARRLIQLVDHQPL